MAARTLWSCWESLDSRAPRRTAIVEADTQQSASVADLTREATELAPAFDRTARSVVAFRLPNSIDWLRVTLALQKAGAAALPLDASLPDDAIESTARALGASFLFDSGGLRRLVSRKRTPWPRACLVKSTSGSTGAPHPIPCEPRHLIADGEHIIVGMALRPSDINLALIPLGHSYGLGNLLMPLLLQGTALLTARAFVPGQIAQWLAKPGATVFPSVPAVFQALTDAPSISDLGRLRLAISAGAPLPLDLAQRFAAKFGLRLHNFYGSSETGGIAYDRTGSLSLSGRSVGRLLDGVRVRIVEGQVEVASAAVAIPGQRHRLPDLGELNARSELTLLGRSRPVANIGGKKVPPAEIENALLALPGVSAAWVTVVTSAGRDLLAAAAETELTLPDLLKALAQSMPAWKTPRRWHLAAQLPRTARGKLDTRALQTLLHDGSSLAS